MQETTYNKHLSVEEEEEEEEEESTTSVVASPAQFSSSSEASNLGTTNGDDSGTNERKRKYTKDKGKENSEKKKKRRKREKQGKDQASASEGEEEQRQHKRHLTSGKKDKEKQSDTGAEKASVAETSGYATKAQLLERKEMLERSLANLEQQIYALETSYLEDTSVRGNIVRGWSGYLARRGAAAQKKGRYSDKHRIFTLSSMTAVKAHGLEELIKPAGASTSSTRETEEPESGTSQSHRLYNAEGENEPTEVVEETLIEEEEEEEEDEGPQRKRGPTKKIGRPKKSSKVNS